MIENPRIVFAGTPTFSVPALQALLDAHYSVVGVYTQPDRPSGRGRKLQESPVKELALQNGLQVFQPLNFKTSEAHQALVDLKPDLMIVVAYGQLLPSTILSRPRLGCINIHASLLPRWRGAAPIQRAILAGDKETGVSIMQMDEGLDTGPVWLKKTCPIDQTLTSGDLHDKLADLGAEALLDVLPMILAEAGEPVEQLEDGACYAAKLNKKEARIDWARSAVEIGQQVRAFNPWPVAQTTMHDQVVRIWQAARAEEAKVSGQPGSISVALDGRVLVQTGEGVLEVLSVQLPGKRQMTAAAWANGYALAGVQLGVL